MPNWSSAGFDISSVTVCSLKYSLHSEIRLHVLDVINSQTPSLVKQPAMGLSCK